MIVCTTVNCLVFILYILLAKFTFAVLPWYARIFLWAPIHTYIHSKIVNWTKPNRTELSRAELCCAFNGMHGIVAVIARLSMTVAVFVTVPVVAYKLMFKCKLNDVNDLLYILLFFSSLHVRALYIHCVYLCTGIWFVRIINTCIVRFS